VQLLEVAIISAMPPVVQPQVLSSTSCIDKLFESETVTFLVEAVVCP
jgi:hypothetical protein